MSYPSPFANTQPAWNFPAKILSAKRSPLPCPVQPLIMSLRVTSVRRQDSWQSEVLPDLQISNPRQTLTEPNLWEASFITNGSDCTILSLLQNKQE